MTDAPEGSPPPAKRRSFGRADFEAKARTFEGDFKAQMATTRAQLDATNAKIEERTGRNLPAAILLGLVLAGALIASLVFVKAFFMIFAGLLIGFTVFELATALRAAGRDIPRIPTVIAGLAIVPAAFFLGDAGTWLVTLGGIVFVSLWRAVEALFPANGTTVLAFWTDIGAGAFVQLYVAFLAGFYVLLAAQPHGEWWTLSALLVVVFVDTGAYVSGLLFGKHPMAPRISPKKTWEGFAGAVVFAILVAIVLSIWLLQMPWWFGLILGPVIVFTATMGDLIESLIKRDLGIKDISNWLPGHGGLLDRMDSILPTGAAAYLLYVIVDHLN